MHAVLPFYLPSSRRLGWHRRKRAVAAGDLHHFYLLVKWRWNMQFMVEASHVYTKSRQSERNVLYWPALRNYLVDGHTHQPSY